MSIPYRKILLPLDGSAIAAQALPHAQEMAAQSGAELVLLQVIPEPTKTLDITPDFQVSQPAIAQQQAQLDHAGRWLQRLADDLVLHKIPTQVTLDVGEPAAKILDYAAKHDIDLIVMSTHGRTGLARWAYGSVAGKVVGAAPCPVLLVRAALEP
jgi:nucleotide-binding universal stress UspA family protein